MSWLRILPSLPGLARLAVEALLGVDPAHQRLSAFHRECVEESLRVQWVILDPQQSEHDGTISCSV